MGRRLRLSSLANLDILGIWEYTKSTYGYNQALTYSELLEQAIQDVVADPERPSSIPRPELGTGVRSYHIELSKHRSGTGIKSPRHVIVYALRYALKKRASASPQQPHPNQITASPPKEAAKAGSAGRRRAVVGVPACQAAKPPSIFTRNG